MINKHHISPEQSARDYGHGLAYQIAGEQLAGIKDYAEQCRKSGAKYVPEEKSAIISYLNDSCRISLPDGAVTYAYNNAEVPPRDKILILHYFLRATGSPLTGNIITYKELREGINYYRTFFKRSIEPIINNFKDSPQKLPETAALLGGVESDYGDTAVNIQALPYVPLTIVLWREDGEFPPDGKIMFDSTIAEYLPMEDITIICEIIAWRLVRLLKTGGGSAG